MIKTALTDTEVELLQGYVKSPVELIRLKALTILARYAGVPLETLSLMFVRSPRTLTRWISDYSSCRLSSIFSGKVGNENAGKLTREQKLEIKEVIGQPPNRQGLPKEFWNVPKLKNYVQVRFGVKYESDISYHFLLRFSGLSLKYPDKLSPRRNDKLINQRMKEIKHELKPLMKNPHWIVFSADETRLQLESEIRRAWLVKGKRTIVKTERSKEHQNYLGLLNQKTGKFTILPIERGNQEETIRVLKLLMREYPNQQVCVIWDNAAWHRGKLIRQALSTNQPLSRLHLIALPPYAPDHNPVEHVWQYAKNKIANRHQVPFSQTKHQFEETITSRPFNYQI